jgi:hypothetical protein
MSSPGAPRAPTVAAEYPHHPFKPAKASGRPVASLSVRDSTSSRPLDNRDERGPGAHRWMVTLVTRRRPIAKNDSLERMMMVAELSLKPSASSDRRDQNLNGHV